MPIPAMLDGLTDSTIPLESGTTVPAVDALAALDLASSSTTITINTAPSTTATTITAIFQATSPSLGG